ncbi:uncharacterized protein MEPE_04198 [Melanopsichium pennsylvanicum]|uniref:Uncharacterized protein n=2 Tax=Melanopsichium pennsylvanicum TaxID=63383 RepID=A0AAJ4XNB1_9BASI|nr:uncharacterized protein MEPE_04198 [Melanopsichium pennsylvanicum]
MAFDVYAEGGSDMLMARARLLEILENLGDNLPADLKHLRRDELNEEKGRQHVGRDKAASDKWREEIEAGPGPSHANVHWAPTAGSTEFESEWACLPPAITALPSFFRIKELVMRNSREKASFRRSLPVLANGIDHCFLSRPTFSQVLLDLEGENREAMPDNAENAGLLPLPPDPLTLTEALWESHFGVPRNLTWYSAVCEFPAGVASCASVHFSPPVPARLGLSRLSVDSPTNVVHCALAGTKRPLSLVGPASGLLYAVTQGSLLLISWPCTDHNFDAWHRLSRSLQTNQFNHLDDFENPTINVLRTGDAVYLAAGTTNIMVALSHVSLTSRQILNPHSKELANIVRCCNRLMDILVDQQGIGYSPFDEMEVERMDANVTTWGALVKHLSAGKQLKNVKPIRTSSAKVPLKNIKPNQPALQDFLRGLRSIDEKISIYRTMVQGAAESAHDKKECTCTHNRPYETLNALAKLSTSAQTSEKTAESDASPLGDFFEATHSLNQYLRSVITIKGKNRAPS